MERDEEGNILSIGLDVVEANRLRSELAVELVQQLEQMSARQYRCTGQPDRFAAAMPAVRSFLLSWSLRQPASGF